MKRKILDIIDEIKFLMQTHSHEKFWIEWYGEYEINPRHLVIWVCVESDATKFKLASNPELLKLLKSTLAKHNYPEEARPLVHIGFESQETVNRESNGNWYAHFK